MNTSTSGCIGKYISPVKMYNKICNSLIYVKIKIIEYMYTGIYQVLLSRLMNITYAKWPKII